MRGVKDMDESDLLFEFVEESRDHLADIETQLLQIEAYGADINDDLVNTVFRAIHSTKGAAGFLGLTQINEVSHRFENVLNNVRDHKLIPDPFNVDVMLKSADCLRNLIEEIETSNDTDNSEVISLLDQVLAGGSVRPSDTAEVAQGTPAETGIENADHAETAQSMLDATEAVVARELSNDEPPAITSPTDAATESATHAPEPPPAVAVPLQKPAAKTKSSESRGSAPSGEATIRVGVRVLDRLMNLAGELVLCRNQLLRVLGEHHSSTPQLDSIASGMDQVTTELQESIMQTRMQPIGNVFGKFPRIIRDLSSSLGKQINLSLEGTEVEVDKTIVEAIADPLTHLIRNSCDHGIELPADRVAAGKEAAGDVSLRAYHQAGKVMIEIVDDGAGIDPARIRGLAVKKNVITAEMAEQMTDSDAINLIFAPGFSTAAAVTAISGRGVGMDVVRTNIEAIGGCVEAKSEFGNGSMIQITLPLTLAIVPSMIVMVANQRYALPQSNIIELVRTDGIEKRIECVSNAEVLRLRGKLIPLVRLRETLNLESAEVTSDTDDHQDQLVVVEAGRNRFAMAVDAVLDSEEIVVKPLGRHLSNLPLLAGATILGDGEIAMILDSAGIANRVALSNDSTDASEDDAKGKQACGSSADTRLLLVATSESDEFAIPMDLISRIERIDASEIDSVGSHKVLRYQGGTLPLVSIDEVVKVDEVAQPKYVHIVVFKIGETEVGLIAPLLRDIQQFDLSRKATEHQEDGVAGIIVMNDVTTRLLDLYGLSKHALPSWFTPGLQNEPDDTDGRVLVVEDSKMFRSFLVKSLTEAGYTTSECEDGVEAWEVLQRDSLFDLVLTDIEMPKMDGIELTKMIRSDISTRALPVIALTSLTDDATRQRGVAAGVDDYQVKMNKPELLACVASHIAKGASK